MINATIYHNPRCSKSRTTLALLQQQDCTINIIEYLKYPLKAEEIQQILQKLGITARELIRTGEQEYKTQGLVNPSLTEAQLIDAMVNTPKLIERPIVIIEQGGAIGRPPEQILTLFAT